MTLAPLRHGVSGSPHLFGTARTTAQNGPDIITDGYRGIRAVVDITNIHAVTPELTITVQGKDDVSGKYFTLLASAALTATGTTVLVVYPGCVAAANAVANLPIPKVVRVIVAVADTDACTYTIGVELLP